MFQNLDFYFLLILGLFKRSHRKKTQIQTDYYFDNYSDKYNPFKFTLGNKIDERIDKRECVFGMSDGRA
jgi:hypothetical protein